MPRYITNSSSVQKPIFSKSYSFALNSLSENATQIENTFSLGDGPINVKKIQLNSVVYPYQAPGIRYNDEKCMFFESQSYATVPYTPQHVFTQGGQDQSFSISAWVRLPAIPTSISHIFWHASEFGLEIDATGILTFSVLTDQSNYLKRSSVETIGLDEWVLVTGTYSPSAGAPLASDISLFINATEATYTDSSMGTHTSMTDGLGSSYIGFNGTDLYAENAYFGDLVLWKTALNSYEIENIWNNGKVKNIGNCPLAVSRYCFGDCASDESDVAITDVLNFHNAACTNTVTITEDAAGGGSANVQEGDRTGTLILSIQNIPEIRNFATLQGNVLGQAFSTSGSFLLEFQGTNEAGVFESYPSQEQGNVLELANAAILTGLQVRLKYLGGTAQGWGPVFYPR